MTSSLPPTGSNPHCDPKPGPQLLRLPSLQTHCAQIHPNLYAPTSGPPVCPLASRPSPQPLKFFLTAPPHARSSLPLPTFAARPVPLGCLSREFPRLSTPHGLAQRGHLGQSCRHHPCCAHTTLLVQRFCFWDGRNVALPSSSPLAGYLHPPPSTHLPHSVTPDLACFSSPP